MARVRVRINTSLDSVQVTLNLSLVDVCQLAERNSHIGSNRAQRNIYCISPCRSSLCRHEWTKSVHSGFAT